MSAPQAEGANALVDELRAERDALKALNAELVAALEAVHKCGNGGSRLSRQASDMVRAALAKAVTP